MIAFSFLYYISIKMHFLYELYVETGGGIYKLQVFLSLLRFHHSVCISIKMGQVVVSLSISFMSTHYTPHNILFFRQQHIHKASRNGDKNTEKKADVAET